MKKITSLAAVGLLATGVMAATSFPVQAAPEPSVTVTITDVSGTSSCDLTAALRGLAPSTTYVLNISGLSPINPVFTTNERGSYRDIQYTVDRSAFNKTVTITTALYLANSGQPPMETKVRIANRCPAS